MKVLQNEMEPLFLLIKYENQDIKRKKLFFVRKDTVLYMKIVFGKMEASI